MSPSISIAALAIEIARERFLHRHLPIYIDIDAYTYIRGYLATFCGDFVLDFLRSSFIPYEKIMHFIAQTCLNKTEVLIRVTPLLYTYHYEYDT